MLKSSGDNKNSTTCHQFLYITAEVSIRILCRWISGWYCSASFPLWRRRKQRSALWPAATLLELADRFSRRKRKQEKKEWLQLDLCLIPSRNIVQSNHRHDFKVNYHLTNSKLWVQKTCVLSWASSMGWTGGQGDMFSLEIIIERKDQNKILGGRVVSVPE